MKLNAFPRSYGLHDAHVRRWLQWRQGREKYTKYGLTLGKMQAASRKQASKRYKTERGISDLVRAIRKWEGL